MDGDKAVGVTAKKADGTSVTVNAKAVIIASGGIRTDDQLRALKADNTPLQGLYVVGTDNGSMYYSPYYDVPGFCYGLCVDSGYIAATEAVEYIK